MYKQRKPKRSSTTLLAQRGKEATIDHTTTLPDTEHTRQLSTLSPVPTEGSSTDDAHVDEENTAGSLGQTTDGKSVDYLEAIPYEGQNDQLNGHLKMRVMLSPCHSTDEDGPSNSKKIKLAALNKVDAEKISADSIFLVPGAIPRQRNKTATPTSAGISMPLGMSTPQGISMPLEMSTPQVISTPHETMSMNQVISTHLEISPPQDMSTLLKIKPSRVMLMPLEKFIPLMMPSPKTPSICEVMSAPKVDNYPNVMSITRSNDFQQNLISEDMDTLGGFKSMEAEKILPSVGKVEQPSGSLKMGANLSSDHLIDKEGSSAQKKTNLTEKTTIQVQSRTVPRGTLAPGVHGAPDGETGLISEPKRSPAAVLTLETKVTSACGVTGVTSASVLTLEPRVTSETRPTSTSSQSIFTHEDSLAPENEPSNGCSYRNRDSPVIGATSTHGLASETELVPRQEDSLETEMSSAPASQVYGSAPALATLTSKDASAPPVAETFFNTRAPGLDTTNKETAQLPVGGKRGRPFKVQPKVDEDEEARQTIQSNQLPPKLMAERDSQRGRNCSNCKQGMCFLFFTFIHCVH